MKNPKCFIIGDRVVWKSKEGTIRGFMGSMACVYFDFLGRELPISPDDLELVKQAKPSTVETKRKVKKRIKKKPAFGEVGVEMLISLEALRFGLVPWNHIKQLTIGYDEIEMWAKDCFPSDKNQGLMVHKIQGDFGEGKSHTLKAIRSIAKENGYLTSWVEVDGTNVTFSRPAGVLQQMWKNLEGNGLETTTKLLDLHLRAIGKYGMNTINKNLHKFYRIREVNNTINLCKRNNRLDDFGHRLDCVLSSIPEEYITTLKNDIWSAIGDNIYYDDITVRPMIGMRVVDRPGDFLKTLIGNALLAKLAGYKGLVITIDEFEVESFYYSSKAHKEKLDRAYNLLYELGKYGDGETDLPEAPISLFIATVGEDDENLSLAYFTQHLDGGVRNLKQLTQQELHMLAEKIYEFYMEGNKLNHRFDNSIIDSVEDSFKVYHRQSTGYTRSFIKQLMYELDNKYGPKGAVK